MWVLLLSILLEIKNFKIIYKIYEYQYMIINIYNIVYNITNEKIITLKLFAINYIQIKM